MNLLDRLLHRRKDEVVSDNTWLVVGLGNPGAQYAGNRHNVGQMVADELAARIGAAFKSHKTPSRVAEGFLGPGRPKLVIAKPNGYMNTSGGPVSALLKFYSLSVDRLIVVHDELDIPFDTVRLKRGGGHGGHNGLRDIQKATASPDFTRVRVGIGRPPGRMDAADFVLRDFAGPERAALPNLLSDAADAVEAVVEDGLVAAQQRFHSPA
ncbi:PTH1 family peptidyl-tRNA hydrolase [Agromyces flavus]|uniref:Peptidyl-tRNA hydrolase n=1 Tax=Agromyces flavus TaxID=589382 RepID=A0A1H1MWE7_9MICO|nr:aminoacyl-tRNA hydrolase [Agromyces flavus]MCP2369195.1 PTH1 family peptidyl-tRNA hydrolase [Agromyces flavus]GGI48676.1 peptidyl-tRNA hydrolase [Agromyces flavus]SDR90922.1 peptidyl-tRNA hydrolase [Agromyces flavus]